MKQRKTTTTPPAAAGNDVRVEYFDWGTLLPWLTSVGFAVAVAVVLARATISESLRNPFEPSPGGDAGAVTGLPNVSVWLDLLCWTPALLVLFRRCFDRTYVLRFTPAHGLVLAMAVLAAASTAWSADRFAAAVTAFHFLSAAVLMWSASQLVRSWTRLRFVAAAAAGALAVVTVHGIYYRTVEWPDTVKYVEENREQILRERGWTQDSFAWRQFNNKVQAGEMVGFGSSPNTYAAVLVFLGVIAASLAAQRLLDGDERAWPVALLAVLPAAAYVLWFTGSKTALVTPLLAAGLIWAGWRLGGWLAERRRTAFFTGVAAFLLGVAAFVGHGLYHGNFVIDSITFRWKYWIGSSRLFAEHALAGVGWSNFGYSYLAHRLPEATEEIKDPHNLFVKAFVELGIVGGLLCLGWIGRLMWEITRPVSPPAPAEPPARRVAAAPGRGAAGLIAGVAGLAVVLNMLGSIDFSRDAGYVLVESLKRLLYFGLFVLALAAGTIRSTTDVRPDDRPAPLLLIGCIAAVGVFLIHNLIDFSMWDVGPMFLLALLSGALIGVRGESLAGRKKWNRTAVVAMAVTLTAWLVAAVGFAMPTADAERRAQAGDEFIRTADQSTARIQRAVSAYRAAAETTPVSNADYLYRAARAMMLAQEEPRQIDVWLSQAIAANPLDGGYRSLRATLWLSQPDDRQPREQIRRDFERAVALDPASLPPRLAYAGALAGWGEQAAADEQFAAALALNEKFDPADPERLGPAEVEAIRRRMSEPRP